MHSCFVVPFPSINLRFDIFQRFQPFLCGCVQRTKHAAGAGTHAARTIILQISATQTNLACVGECFAFFSVASRNILTRATIWTALFPWQLCFARLRCFATTQLNSTSVTSFIPDIYTHLHMLYLHLRRWNRSVLSERGGTLGRSIGKRVCRACMMCA